MLKTMKEIGLAIVLVTAITSGAFCCMCKKFRRHRLLRQSEFVFIGQALNNLTPDSITSKILDIRGYGTSVIFKIEKRIKGHIDKDTIAIIQNNCPMTFTFGDKYVVFGMKRERLYDSSDIYSPIVQLDSSDTRPDEEIMNNRRERFEQDKLYEKSIRDKYGLIIDTSLCSCTYETGKTFKKYMRRTRTAGNNVHAP